MLHIDRREPKELPSRCPWKRVKGKPSPTHPGSGAAVCSGHTRPTLTAGAAGGSGQGRASRRGVSRWHSAQPLPSARSAGPGGPRPPSRPTPPPRPPARSRPAGPSTSSCTAWQVAADDGVHRGSTATAPGTVRPAVNVTDRGTSMEPCLSRT
uniref:Uncharacterized protein n=1 Tax=Rousettus aegyptiacus TaxID=9407 RepID=A0A7J8KAI8_ROUAE|nr:hypothetical protein HJG63_007732 [Rousettus aegyptiacus]